MQLPLEETPSNTRTQSGGRGHPEAWPGDGKAVLGTSTPKSAELSRDHQAVGTRGLGVAVSGQKVMPGSEAHAVAFSSQVALFTVLRACSDRPSWEAGTQWLLGARGKLGAAVGQVRQGRRKQRAWCPASHAVGS